MNSQSRMFQRLGGLGVVFSLLFAAAFVLTGNQPSTGASAVTVMKYFHAHRASEMASVFVLAAAAIVFFFFLSSLRRSLGRTIEGRQIAPLVTAGGAVYVSGLLLMGALLVALVDSAHYGMGATAQTLNVLSSDAWVPVVVGISILTLGTGFASLRSAALPRWLAWASIGLGILAIAGPLGALAFMIMPLWTLAAGIVLFRSSTPEEVSVTSPRTVPGLVSSNI